MIQNQELLMAHLMRFYKDPTNLKIILPIIQGHSKTPLRLYNWFVTNYCKENQVIIKRKVKGGESYLNVYISYKTQLRNHSKTQFDPFRRDEKRRIIFRYDSSNQEKFLDTTVGQLNFFKWAIESGVVDFITKNKLELEKQMKLTSVEMKNTKIETHKGETSHKVQTVDKTTVVTFD